MSDSVFLAGCNGMVGSAILRRLEADGGANIVAPTRQELDLTSQQAVNDFFKQHDFSQVYIAAARVGGIHANNTYPAEFIYQNLMIECNLIHAAHEAGIDRLLFLGSSCIYPKLAPQPMQEKDLLDGHLELTNEPYAVAKIAGIKLCESYNRQYGHDYRSLQPTNLYGPGDNYHPENSHVIPALLRRFHEATLKGDNEIVVWGSGKPKREFLHVDDLAQACVFIMAQPKAAIEKHTSPMISHINVGTGEDCSIAELAQLVKEVTGFKGNIVFDTSKPDGPPRKLLDVSRIRALGWRHKIPLRDGLKDAYDWYLANQDQLRTQ